MWVIMGGFTYCRTCSFSGIILMKLSLNFEAVFEIGEVSFCFSLGLGFLNGKILGDVRVGLSHKASHLFLIVCGGSSFGVGHSSDGSLGKGNVSCFGGPGTEGAIVVCSQLGDSLLEVCSDKVNIGIDPCLDSVIIIEGLLVN
jgi:hypothetical protein